MMRNYFFFLFLPLLLSTYQTGFCIFSLTPMALTMTTTLADPLPPPSGATSTRQIAADPTTHLVVSGPAFPS
jgi:hypothetical protein